MNVTKALTIRKRNINDNKVNILYGTFCLDGSNVIEFSIDLNF